MEILGAVSLAAWLALLLLPAYLPSVHAYRQPLAGRFRWRACSTPG